MSRKPLTPLDLSMHFSLTCYKCFCRIAAFDSSLPPLYVVTHILAKREKRSIEENADEITHIRVQDKLLHKAFILTPNQT